MKKTIILLTALTLLLVLTGCTGGKSNNNSSNKTGNQTNIATPNNCTGGGEIKHGYQLPPCPDPVENAKTLLGIDTNNNGVRDDVEIWIYHRYDTHKNCTTVETGEVVHNGTVIGTTSKTVCTDEDIPYHQIVREIAMQGAKATQIIIQEPEKARENVIHFSKAGECAFYFTRLANKNNEPILVNNFIFGDDFHNIQFNTIQRAKAYAQYNFNLSGTSYQPPKTDKDYREACSFNVDALLEK